MALALLAVTMHEAAMTYVREALNSTKIWPGPVVEIGGRNINGTIRRLFRDVGPYLSIDLYDGPDVDIVANVCDLEPKSTLRRVFDRQTATCVVCCEVLEHAPDADRICAWAYHALAPGGIAIFTAAGPSRFSHSGIDGGNLHPGEFYRNVSEPLLRSWLMPPFASADISYSQGEGDIYATATKGAAGSRRLRMADVVVRPSVFI